MSAIGTTINRLKGPEIPSRVPGGRAGIVLLLSFLFALAYLGGMNRTLYLAGRVESLTQEYEALRRSVDLLELQIWEERSGGKVVVLARERLGMDFPQGNMEILAVQPAATRNGPSLRTYLGNALAMTLEGVERGINPSAQAGEAAPPDSSRGGGLP